jgi:wobble nucleotide-excising tRNase
LQDRVGEIEGHNRALRTKADAIPAAIRGTLSVDEFCALPSRADIDDALVESRRALAAVSEAASIQRAAPLEHLVIPAIPLASITRLVQRDLPSLDSAAVARVETQLTLLGSGAAAWVSEGVRKLSNVAASPRPCPFCTQDTIGVDIIERYRLYFSDEYAKLKSDIAVEIRSIESEHGAGVRQRVAERAMANEQRWHYWSRFVDLPTSDVDVDRLLMVWSNAVESTQSLLERKNSSPLEPQAVDRSLNEKVAALDALRNELEKLNRSIDEIGGAIALVKERAASGNAAVLESDLRQLTMIKARHSGDVDAACNDYLGEQGAKLQTEARRDQARIALDSYRDTTFPAYETAINLYLQRLYAGFRVSSVTSTANRGGASCTYNVVVDDAPIAVNSSTDAGLPSFGNVLSAGDRNTLALAFFFASLDQDPTLPQRIVVVDDPMTSLDEHRLLATAQLLRRLAHQAAQVIVLSHDKPFLFAVWDNADRATRSALELFRDANGTGLRDWDATEEIITEHDNRHAALREYLQANNGTPRDVAEGLRPILERFLRVAYPEFFGPGDRLPQFIARCESAINSGAPILSGGDLEELADLREYANRFHHDTNTGASSEVINDAELVQYGRRVFNFARRT